MDVNDGHISGPSGQGPQSVADTGGGADTGAPVALGDAEEPPIHPRLLAMIVAGRYHGLELDPNEFRGTPGRRGAVRRVAVQLGAERRHVGARGAAALAPPDAVPQYRPGGAAVHRRHGGPADRRSTPSTRWCSSRTRPVPTSDAPVAVDELRLSRGVGRRGGAAARQPRLSPRPTRRSRCAGCSAW